MKKSVIFSIVFIAAVLTGCSQGVTAGLSGGYSSLSADTAAVSEDIVTALEAATAVSEDAVTSENEVASGDTATSDNTVSTGSIAESNIPKEDTGVHETPKELQWTIFTDTAPEGNEIGEYVSMVEKKQIHYYDYNVGKAGKAEHTGCLDDLLKAAGLYRDDLKAIYVDGIPGQNESRLILLYLKETMDRGIALKYEWIRHVESDPGNHCAYGLMNEWADCINISEGSQDEYNSNFSSMAYFEEELWNEDIYVPFGVKSEWEKKQQYYDENDYWIEEHVIRDDKGRIQEIKLWKDTPSYPEETDEPDGWVYSKSYEYREDGSVKAIGVGAHPSVFGTASSGYMQYDRLNRRVYLNGGRTHGEYFVLYFYDGESTKPAYSVYLDTYTGGMIHLIYRW
ncbi:MAG: hypothetical protein IJU93_06735 [Lachnospiraceae bacterium]|nr:hypothetical protein [Lachnospiraceae bacterium]